MKKFITWCVIIVVFSIGLLSVALYYLGYNMPLFVRVLAFILSIIIMFSPALKHWERYFKELLGYND